MDINFNSFSKKNLNFSIISSKLSDENITNLMKKVDNFKTNFSSIDDFVKQLTHNIYSNLAEILSVSSKHQLTKLLTGNQVFNMEQLRELAIICCIPTEFFVSEFQMKHFTINELEEMKSFDKETFRKIK